MGHVDVAPRADVVDVRLGHVPVLDAIRGIAILLVLAVHADHRLPGGVLGVDLFFVLSGFLITSLLLTEWSRDGRISLLAFYRRRALRLLPALVVMLSLVTVVSLLASEHARSDLGWALYSLGYVINLAALQDGGIQAEHLQHMWSLSQEEQFYLVWPILLVALLRKRVRPTRLTMALGAVAAGLLAYRVVLAAAGVSASYLLYAPETRSVGLILGCLAGVLFSYGLVLRVPLWLPTALLPPAALAVATLGMYSRSDAVFLLPLFCVAATVVLLACVLHPEWWFARLVDRAWLRGLGKVSYGLYLWHWPLYYAFGWKVGLPLAILVAVVSYRLVEQPFLRRRHPHRSQSAEDRSRPVAEYAPSPAPSLTQA